MKTIYDEIDCRYSFEEMFPRVIYNNGIKHLQSQTYKMLIGLENQNDNYDKEYTMKDKFIKNDDFSSILYYYGAELLVEIFNKYSEDGNIKKCNKIRNVVKCYLEN